MKKITIHQSGVKATLHEVFYHPAEESEEMIRAESDTKLTSGPAELRRKEDVFAVNIEVLQFKELAAEDEDLEEDELVCEIDIRPAEGGLPQLADGLGLLDRLSKKKRKALLGIP